MNADIYKFIFIIVAITFLVSCNSGENKEKKLIVFHAGSLSVPLKEISQAYEKQNPGVNILLEATGSRQCARKITELNKKCDLMASADYTVIEDLLIPDFANWYISFANNQMCIAYTLKSRKKEIINTSNWYKILLLDEVIYGRSDPNTDPCGYRTSLVFQLAEFYYKNPGLNNSLLEKDNRYIRPKEVDLLALLESGALDYIFIYKSVAEQHKLEILELPKEINLGYPEYNNLYKNARVEISGKSPGTSIVKNGEAMIYALTIPENAPDNKLAIDFVKFILDAQKGMKIMQKNGQESLIPSPNPYFQNIPESLKNYAKPLKP